MSTAKKATKKKVAKKTTAKKKILKLTQTPKAKPSGSLILIDPRDIIKCENPRYPLSDEMRKNGFGVLGTFPQDSENTPLKDLWRMASSDDQDDRTTYTQLIEDSDESIRQLGQTIITASQLQPIGVSEAPEKGKYILAFGQRRCLAVLYNYCKGLSKKCLIEAKVKKQNENDAFASAIIENQARKAMSVVEEGYAFLRMKNMGLTEKEIANEQGLSESTVKNRIKLTTLDKKIQDKIAAGKINASDALESSRKKRESKDGAGEEGEGAGGSSSSGSCYKLKKKAEVVEKYESATGEFKEALGWVLSVE